MAIPRRVMAEQPRGIIRSVKDMSGFEILARNGRIGSVEEFYFDDISWAIRYVVVNTGGWLTGRQVLISPSAVLEPDWERKVLSVDLTREQVEKSPGIESDAAVSRKHQIEMYKYYGWAPYWSAGIPPGGAFPVVIPPEDTAGEEEGDTHLRSSKEVIGYRIQAADGTMGEVDDFLVDDQTWMVRYMVVDTRAWLPGRKVLVAVSWIKSIEWPKQLLSVNLAKDVIRNAPEYTAPSAVNPEYEERLFGYYNLPAYWL